MELTYKNTEIDQINLPTTITFADNADKILELLKSSDVKCVAESDGKKTSITFDIADIEKLSRVLQPVGIDKQLDSALEIPKVDKKEKLIPIVNGMSNLYDRKINSKSNRIAAHQKHIDVLSSALEQRKKKAETLSDRNDMLKKLTSTFPAFKNPINALVERNEKKIERLQNKVEKLEKQIEIHSNTIDKLNKNVQNFTLRKKACQSLSDIVRSFTITNKENRNQSYLNALSSFNASMHSINDMKINNYNESIEKIKNDFSNLSPAAKQNAQERVTKITAARTTLENKNKALEAASPDITAMLNKLNDNTTTKTVDRAEVMFDQALSNSGQNIDNIMSNISINSARAVSPTAVEIVLNSTNVITGINDKDKDMIPDKLDSTFNVENDNQDLKRDDFIELGLISNGRINNDCKLAYISEKIKSGDQSWSETSYTLYKDGNFYGCYDSGYSNDLNYYYKITEEEAKEKVSKAMSDVSNGYVTELGKKFLNNELVEKRDTYLMLVSKEELDALIKEKAPIKVNYKQKSEDGKFPILMEKTDKPKIEKVLDAMKNENRKVRK